MMKYAAFGCTALIIPILAAATVLEKLRGSDFAREHIYVALPMLLLWGVASGLSLLYLLKRKAWRRPATFCLHLSFVLILVGALVTHLSGRQGRIHLRTDGEPVRSFSLDDGGTGRLPFAVSLADFHLEYHEGTAAPSDFVSTIRIDDGTEGVISMNNIFTYKHYRFYQSGYDADAKGTFLSVSRDPWGIAVTYTGYLWLLLSMIGFFFERNSTFRRLLHHPSLHQGLPVLLLALLPSGLLSAAPHTLSREAADEFCDLHVYYNDRICPLSALANDFTVKLYGKSSYEGLTAEQVLTGWLFWYDDWKHEPVIKIKGAEIARILGLEGKYARLTDFTDIHGYKLDEVLRGSDALRRNAQAANEKFNLVSSLCTGSLLKIYPYSDPASGKLLWYSLSDRPAEDMPYEQWMFIRGCMDLVAEKVAMKDEAGIRDLLGKIRRYQIREAGSALPSASRFRTEKLCIRTNVDKPLALSCLTLGILLFIASCWSRSLRENLSGRRSLPGALADGLSAALLLWLTFQIGLRWFVSRHVPLSNGFETMHFMAWCSVLLTLCLRRRFRMARPFGFLLCGFTLLVAMMGEASPRITNLIPVLQSPLLSIHVMVIMAAYTLLAFTMLNGITAAVLRLMRKDAQADIEYLAIVSRQLLYPAVFLLTAGIFVGAVWANVSWGRYWGWDPKEVWALVTMMVYAAALHGESLPWFRRPMALHLFCIFAFFSVLITYFGVNFLLGGLHSYA